MKLSKIGEFGLIERIKNIIGDPARKALLGIGDDTAVIELPSSNLLLTTDALVEGVHFRPQGTSFYDLGVRSLAVNISDIASMGGRPTFALVTIGANRDMAVKKIEELYRGIRDLAKKYKIGIVGGETVASPGVFFISVTLLGEAEKGRLIARSGAKAGDAILVTGDFGGPRAEKFDIKRSRLNIRLKESEIIARSKMCTSMIDSSDGLVRSVIELCRAGRVGARIFSGSVPIAKKSNLEQALYGGEEYELVFTAPKDKAEGLRDLIRRKTRTRVSICGRIVPKSGDIKIVDAGGKASALRSKGYEHFK